VNDIGELATGENHATELEARDELKQLEKELS